MASPQDILLNALKDANIVSVDEAAIPSDYTALALSKFNRRVSLWNSKGSLGSYVYTQIFTLPASPTISPNGYSIGASADSPKLIVTAGRPPANILSAKRLQTNGSTIVERPIPVFSFQQWDSLRIPGIATTLTIAVYLQTIPKLPILWCYGFSSGEQLRLSWEALINTVAISDISTNIDWNDGVEEALISTLTVDLAMALQKPVSQDQKMAARDARMSMQAYQGMPYSMESDYPTDRGGNGYSIADFYSRTVL